MRRRKSLHLRPAASSVCPSFSISDPALRLNSSGSGRAQALAVGILPLLCDAPTNDRLVPVCPMPRACGPASVLPCREQAPTPLGATPAMEPSTFPNRQVLSSCVYSHVYSMSSCVINWSWCAHSISACAQSGFESQIVGEFCSYVVELCTLTY